MFDSQKKKHVLIKRWSDRSTTGVSNEGDRRRSTGRSVGHHTHTHTHPALLRTHACMHDIRVHPHLW
jgi:hypothetical protein